MDAGCSNYRRSASGGRKHRSMAAGAVRPPTTTKRFPEDIFLKERVCMKAYSHEISAGQTWPARSVRTVNKAVPLRSLILLAVLVAARVCAAHAQTLIGTHGAGWQTCNLAVDNLPVFIDLNSNGSL